MDTTINVKKCGKKLKRWSLKIYVNKKTKNCEKVMIKRCAKKKKSKTNLGFEPWPS